ncbi:peptide chain release factor N(5)-glutamine methyltransferase [Pararhizobium sp. IMCC21322]|uniref:peptide chain release factor N(5)-glutamine methyltransferase n=1 Tax=Pararhizobium sp. IMCC21322 TaxID=3067903 RepID=UPI0027422604|nr:peptide chain release factor N(5)-glutamine methyltransferase [Pararhizobium sp. IMCC21322]
MQQADQPLAVLPGDNLTVALQTMRLIIERGLKAREIFIDCGLDARMLLLHHMQLSHAELIAAPTHPLTERDADALTELATLRGAGVPVARLVGEAEFWSLPFYLSDDTLVPRPDSELIVEAALSRIGDGATRILDVGTGTGCLPLAILSERPRSTALGVDISQGALTVAERNARRLDVASRFSTCLSDVYDGIPKTDVFDVILSNPPYIMSNVIDGLDTEVRDHDPLVALDGGSDGLDVYRPLIARAALFLLPGGYLIVEIGYDQSSSVSALMREAGFKPELLHDLAGHPRVLIGHKSEPN